MTIGASGIVEAAIGASGYIKYASGLIMQCCRQGLADNIDRVFFPTAFTNSNDVILANASLNPEDNRDCAVSIKWKEKSSAQADLFLNNRAGCFNIKELKRASESIKAAEKAHAKIADRLRS